MIDFPQFHIDLAESNINQWAEFFSTAVKDKLAQYTHGELSHWQQLIEQLPHIKPSTFNIERSVSCGIQQDLTQQLSTNEIQNFKQQLMELHPWRKGPFELFGIEINTEWRSDWKWERILPHISSLKNRTVLDVGCGNGYHCWRMLGEQAKVVIGIDPSQKFLAQFSVIKKYLGQHPVHLLPLGIEDMPESMGSAGFDTVFSMGVLYHRKSPINHLLQLKNLLAKNGELVLETLVIPGDQNQVLMPVDRYAQMRNVWFLPSASALELWLSRCGFKDIRTVNVNQTSLDEQRSTDWMTFHSLREYLDPLDINKTIEGYPAPTRAILIAKNS